MVDGYEQEFETLWRKYPKKLGKTRALDAYIKARKKEKVTFEEVSEGLDKYLAYCQKESSWYKPKHGATWFYQRSWNDEIDSEIEQTPETDEFGNIIL